MQHSKFFYYCDNTHGTILQCNTCIATLQFEQALGAHSEWYTKLRFGSKWLHMSDPAAMKLAAPMPVRAGHTPLALHSSCLVTAMALPLARTGYPLNTTAATAMRKLLLAAHSSTTQGNFEGCKIGCVVTP